MEKKKSKGILVVIVIMGLLIIADIVATVLTIKDHDILLSITNIISLVFVALYGYWLYKKPHGNMLKYAMIVVAVAEFLNAAQCIRNGYDATYLHTVRLFVAAVLVYVAGRLDRVEQNQYILPVAAIISLLDSIVVVILAADVMSPLYVFTWFSGAISIIALMIAYFARYKEHKEAGIEGDSNK